jgi:branched-chain amino acid transport system substrate-binding protein
VLGQAIEGSKTLDNDKLAEYMHNHPFHTIMGDLAFGPDGEWTEGRPIRVQYHGIKGHDVEQFREPKTVPILSPPQYKTGGLVYPYTEARKSSQVAAALRLPHDGPGTRTRSGLGNGRQEQSLCEL